MEPSQERREKIRELVSKIRQEEQDERKEQSISQKIGKADSSDKNSKGEHSIKSKKQSQRTSFIYLGWRHRESPSSQYVQIRGVDKGGGLRRIAFREYSPHELLEEAKKIFFPGNVSKYEKAGNLDECDCVLGTFAGDVLPTGTRDETFSVSEYLTKHGLYASRVRFYLLTTSKCLRSEDCESFEEDSSESHLETKQNDSTSSITLSNPSTSGTSSGDVQSGNDMKHQEQKPSLYIDGDRKSMEVEFNRDEISRYTSEVSSRCIVGWLNCFSERSTNFFECPIEEYHPCSDRFVVRCISINDQVYVQPNQAVDSMFQETYTYPAINDLENSELPVILHEPDEINGYDSDSNLLIGIVTNFHNEIGVTYTWYKNEDVYLCGKLHPVIRVDSAGLYHCEIQYGDKVINSSAVKVLEKDSSSKRENTSVDQQLQHIVEIPLENMDVNWKVPIGVGTFGKVYHGTWLCTDVAIKQIRRGATVKESIQREARIHSLLRHPNIVTFMGMYYWSLNLLTGKLFKSTLRTKNR